jgi:hypothetical protein
MNQDTGAFEPLHSPHKGSPESQVNTILQRIHKEQGNHAYIKNRFREQISALVFNSLLSNGACHPSSIVNDILHGVDAILS